MPRAEQLELVDAHPRIGAPPGTVSAHSYREQGYDRAHVSDPMDVAAVLGRLNDAYEARFGFRFVVFVAGRPREAIVPLIESALVRDPKAELRRALTDVVAIARDRAARTGVAADAIPGHEEQA
jgi:2-oxo-4-hydroxy-4-carboxy-5-ureidoimidazoline decarboxylase